MEQEADIENVNRIANANYLTVNLPWLVLIVTKGDMRIVAK